MSRPCQRHPYWLAWLPALAVLLGLGGAALGKTPASYVIVYDLSQSMWDSSRSEARYLLAQQHAADFVNELRNKPYDLPVGLVVFGHRFPPLPVRCDDVETRVPLQTIGRGRETLEQVRRAVLDPMLRPTGQTPLLPALIEAARIMPPEGGEMTVMTNLEAFECGDPCIELAPALARMGKPLGTVVNVRLVVVTGLDPVKARKAEEFARCMGADSRIVMTRADATAAAREAVGRLTQEALRPAAPLPPMPVQAGSEAAAMVLELSWDNPIVYTDWHFDELRAELWFLDRYQRRTSKPVLSARTPFEMAVGTRPLRVMDADQRWTWYDELRERAEASRTVFVKLAASRVIAGVSLPAGRSAEGLRFEWTVEMGQHKRVLDETRPQMDAALPPGTHTVSLRVRRDGLAWSEPVRQRVDVGFREIQRIFLPLPEIPGPAPTGQLTIDVVVPGVGEGGDGRAYALQNARREVVAEFISHFEGTLAAGTYSLVGDGSAAPVGTIVVDTRQLTRVRIVTGEARLRIRAIGQDGVALTGSGVHWEVAGEDQLREIDLPIFDFRIRPGRYHVKVSSGREHGGCYVDIPGGVLRNFDLRLSQYSQPVPEPGC